MPDTLDARLSKSLEVKHQELARGFPADGRDISTFAALDLDEAVSLARYSTTEEQIAVLVRRLPEHLREVGEAAIRRVSPSGNGSEMERLTLKGKLSIPASTLMEDARTEGAAVRLLDWLTKSPQAASGMQVSEGIFRLLGRFPAALTPERARDLALLSLSMGWAASGMEEDSLVGLLLKVEAFERRETIHLHRAATGALQTLLICSPLATPELWLSVAEQYSLTKGDKKYRYQRENIKTLINHAPAMAIPEVRNALVKRRDISWLGAGGENKEVSYLIYLLRRVPPEGVSSVVERLLAASPLRGLATIAGLPAAQRKFVQRDAIVELAASHPDSQVRQAAILFTTALGKDVREVGAVRLGKATHA